MLSVNTPWSLDKKKINKKDLKFKLINQILVGRTDCIFHIQTSMFFNQKQTTKLFFFLKKNQSMYNTIIQRLLTSSVSCVGSGCNQKPN